jgi:hypothetical protein
MSVRSPSRSILDHFSALEDPRQSWRVAYPLPEILLLVLCGTLTGMDDFVEIALWGEQRLDFLRRFLPYERGIPAHDTLNDVVNALDPEVFNTCFTSWVESLREAEPDIVAMTARHRGELMRDRRGASRCIWSRPGPAANGSSSARRRSRTNRTRSSPSPCCWSGWS